ncbi:hypothetical protein PG984_014938 [Apiospora sp. TS-2023a]
MNINPDDRYENFEDYEPGGFYPIDLSPNRKRPMVIQDRFEIVAKLGYGGSGMVWLCYETAAKRWRAVKIYKASKKQDPEEAEDPENSEDEKISEDQETSEDSESTGDSESMGDSEIAADKQPGELLLQSVLEENSISVAEALENHVLLPLETFYIESVNGRHLCQVHHVLGPRLSDWMEWFDSDQPDRNKHTITQLVKGLGFLHQNGICHGDFRPQNVLMQLKDGELDTIGVEEMRREILGPPCAVNIRLRNGAKSPYSPEKAYAKLDWTTMARLVSDKIAITGFGEAYLPSDPPTRLRVPLKYAAPEVLLKGSADKGIGTDMYTLGRTLLAFRTRRREGFDWENLGQKSPLARLEKDWERIQQMEMYGGPCPPPFRELAGQKLAYDGEGTVERPREEIHISPQKNDDKDSETPSDGYLTFSITVEDPDSEGDTGTEENHVVSFIARKLRWCLSPEEAVSFGDLLHRLLMWHPQERWTTDKILTHRWFSEEHKPGKKFILQDYKGLIDGEGSETQGVDGENSTTQGIDGDNSATQGIDSEDPVTQNSRPKWCSYLALATFAFYTVGVFLMVLQFTAYLLESQPSFHEPREVSSGATPVSPPSTVVPHVKVIFSVEDGSSLVVSQIPGLGLAQEQAASVETATVPESQNLGAEGEVQAEGTEQSSSGASS